MLKAFERAHTQPRGAKKISAIVIFCIATMIASTAQSVHLVATFDGSNGVQPVNLVQGFDGTLYGETTSGGTYNGGSIFQVTPTPSLNSLYSFCAQIVHTCTDGSTLQGDRFYKLLTEIFTERPEQAEEMDKRTTGRSSELRCRATLQPSTTLPVHPRMGRFHRDWCWALMGTSTE